MIPTRPHAPRPSEDQIALIDALGGPKAVADILAETIRYALSPQAVSMWKARGIPFRYRLPLALKAVEQEIQVPADFLGGAEAVLSQFQRVVEGPRAPADAEDDVPEFLREGA